jgi:hypothetical protein
MGTEGDAMTHCIGWESDDECPVYGQFHGCKVGGHTLHERRRGRSVHRCACGAETEDRDKG